MVVQLLKCSVLKSLSLIFLLILILIFFYFTFSKIKNKTLSLFLFKLRKLIFHSIYKSCLIIHVVLVFFRLNILLCFLVALLHCLRLLDTFIKLIDFFKLIFLIQINSTQRSTTVLQIFAVLHHLLN